MINKKCTKKVEIEEKRAEIVWTSSKIYILLFVDNIYLFFPQTTHISGLDCPNIFLAVRFTQCILHTAHCTGHTAHAHICTLSVNTAMQHHYSVSGFWFMFIDFKKIYGDVYP